MWDIRLFEEEIDKLFAQGFIHGTTHLAIGQEASAVGSGAVLKKTDWITSTHRGHGHTIAKGCDINEMMAELFGRTTGTNNGKGGSMHIADLDTGNLGSNGVVGGGFPIAVGAALSSKLKGDEKVTFSYGGDGSTNQGSFHESVNMASIWNLPVVFFIENNLYAISGRVEKMMNVENISVRAKAYGIQGVTIDGNDLIAVINATYEAVEKARRGEGPTLIESMTYRVKGHSKSDNKHYRPDEEVNEWRQNRDPLKLTKEKFIQAGIFSQEEAEEIRLRSRQRIQEAIIFAQESPVVGVDTLFTDIFAD
ncbi:MAG: thiamine pyrophosphate-dependent dehydrogenase E1 component subunit alpha [Streptococcaceae bacterium]|nr:thiamine pyrophosphate-dependent dehydrogenase E1 component subunit alpha [Streptococcaceae bacterium]